MIIFPKHITGRPDCLSISIPRNIVSTFGLTPDEYFSVTLKNKDLNLNIQFNKLIRKCGSEDLIIYIPLKLYTEENKDKLKKGMLVNVFLEEV